MLGYIVLYYIDELLMKAHLDDDLQATVLLLEQKYPFETCPGHPRKHCFHYLVTNKHFDLTHPQLLVWAAVIVSTPLCWSLLLTLQL